MSKHKSIFVAVVGAPHETDLITSLFRLIHESLKQGHSVEVWACGYSTMLTQDTLTEKKPGTYLVPEDQEPVFPTTASLIKELIESSNGKMNWGVCDYCKRDRGANNQIDEVEVRMSLSMVTRMNVADVSMVMGTF